MNTELEKAPLQDLIDRFVENSVAQSDALNRFDTAKFNRLFDQNEEVEQELRSRPGDQRRALLALYEHPNMQVRLNAAKTTLAVAPEAARAQLQAIRLSQHFPQAGDAGMALWTLEEGIYKPV